MKTYYPGDTLPDGYYWLFCTGCEQPGLIQYVKGNKVADFRGDYLDLWDEEPESKAIGPIPQPE